MVKNPKLNIQLILQTRKGLIRQTNEDKTITFYPVYYIYRYVKYHKTWFHNKKKDEHKSNPYI